MIKKAKRTNSDPVNAARAIGTPNTGKPTVGPRNVGFVRQELNNLIPFYFTIRDAIEGEPAIKGLISSGSNTAPVMSNGSDPYQDWGILTRAMKYLPMPNAQDRSIANQERYRSYVKRAVYYNATGRTLVGMAGQVFLRPPVVTIPARLKPMLKNIDGSGLTERNLAQRAVKDVLAYGRAGLLIDFPVTDGAVTAGAVNAGKALPTFTLYYPWDIINWSTDEIDGKLVLTQVVLRESMSEEGDDGFSIDTYDQYRVLRLDPDTKQHTITIYRQTETGSKTFIEQKTLTPKDGTGSPLNAIPFMFIGSESNTVVPNKPPLYDLASINIAHYRNSADYEEQVYVVGQVTPVITGVDENWVKNVLKGAVGFGSRNTINLPPGATAALMQAKENSMAFEAMTQKEGQMVSLGAKLVEKMATVRTAVETIIETTSESSTLTNCANNVSSAFEWGFTIAAGYLNIPVKQTPSTDGTTGDGDIVYRLNTDFDLMNMTAQEVDSLVASWQAGAIAWPEMREGMRKAGRATMPDNEALDAIHKEQAAQSALMGVIADPVGDGAPAGGDGAPAPNSGKKGSNGTGVKKPVGAPATPPKQGPPAKK